MAEFEGLLTALVVAVVAAPAVWVWCAAADEADLGVEPDPRLIAEIAHASRLPQRPPAVDDAGIPQLA